MIPLGSSLDDRTREYETSERVLNTESLSLLLLDFLFLDRDFRLGFADEHVETDPRPSLSFFFLALLSVSQIASLTLSTDPHKWSMLSRKEEREVVGCSSLEQSLFPVSLLDL
jgi:hypothetical protein